MNASFRQIWPNDIVILSVSRLFEERIAWK